MKIISSHILVYFILWVIFASEIRAVRKEAQSWVFSSQYDRMHQITDPSGPYNNIKVAKKGKLVFIAAGDSGIIVVDPAQDHNIIYRFLPTEYVEGFAISKNANHVFMSYNKKFTIFDFSSRKQFVQLGQDSAEIQNIDMIINDDENLVYILEANGNVRAINVSDKSAPKQVGQVSWFPTQIYRGLLSIDDNWLLLSQNFQGLGIYKITQSPDGTVTFTFAGAFLGSKSSSQAVDMTNDMKFIVNLDNRKGVSIGDFELITKAGAFPVYPAYTVQEWWPTDITLPTPQSLCISDDGKFLFLGVLAQGVFIIDIQDKTQPMLYQTIITPFHGLSIKLSFDESELYYANGEAFYVFPKISPNLNEQYINLFNGHLSQGFKNKTQVNRRCYIDDAKNIYYGAFDDDGLWVIDVKDHQNMKTIVSKFKPQQSTGVIDSIIFKDDFKIMILPVVDGTNVIAIFDTSNIAKPLNHFDNDVIQKVAYPTTNFIVDFDLNQAEDILVGAMGNSVIFFDVKTPGNYKILKVWNFKSEMKGDCTGIMFKKGDDYLIGASRGYGYFILNIKDLDKIELVTYFDSLGAENIVSQDNQNDYCFFIDGIKGILIVDLTRIPNISIISQIQVPGWSNDITFLNNQKQMLVSTLEKSMVTLVDISDLKNPFLVAEYLYENQNGMSTCAFKDNSYIFINNNIGVRTQPTKGDVIMHVEAQQVLGFDDELYVYRYQKLDIQKIFLVGTVIQLDIVFLYQPLDIIVDKLIFYQNQTKFDLPDWIQFDPDELSIKINVTKEAIDPTNYYEPFLNVIIVKTLNPLYRDDFSFIGADCPTTDGERDAIYDYVLENSILDDRNSVDPDLELSNEKQYYIFDNSTPAKKKYNLCISKILKFTLLNSIQYTPIYLFMKSTLIFNLKPQDNQSYIETDAKQLRVNMLIPKFSGQFIFVNTDLKISLNQERNDLDISGSVDDVNYFLSKNKVILFPNPTNQFSFILVKLKIQDYVNYDIQKTLYVSQMNFIEEKQKIQIIYDLKEQLSDEYENCEIEIITDFLFQFDKDSFVSRDTDAVLKYSALIQKGDEFVPLKSNFWLKYNPEEYKFFGNPPLSAFNDIITIQLQGNDGYTTVSDTFQIKVKKLPTLFVIKWISLIISLIIGALVLYKYRHIIYNAIFNRQTKTKKQLEMQKIDDNTKLYQSISPIGTKYPDEDNIFPETSNAIIK